ncbi:hypothetical protein CPB85DRAFT_1441577 [Mucidula mucida]|nr:hypothetical protein CPB85DRAFT_1441577 [Mucidula mucida]
MASTLTVRASMNNVQLIQAICSSYDWIHSYSRGGALHDVLSHNGEPTMLQAAIVASSKAFVESADERITQDIDNMGIALKVLRVRRHSLKLLSVHHARALSKFRWLPNEILAQIFLHVGDAERFVVGCFEERPWKLRKVCRKWAGIVDGCSRLWCDMVIHVAGDVLRPATFAQILQLCGSRPLHITLSMQDLDYDYLRPIRQKKFYQVIAILTPSSPRWESLTIESSEDLIRVVLE